MLCRTTQTNPNLEVSKQLLILTTSTMSERDVHRPPWNSYAKIPNSYGPYAYYNLNKGVACAQHIQLPTHTRE